ncbi:hypothetical protein GCM10017083_53590 [Thalassobaculum fulvum]|jgi:quercetin dioxygenase-like cupin family protein|uniref:Cupin type-2 domain-containing protein n=1 Tax=Thalassobaculum fulvum TaxID=1633335 RepID=A0A919CSQ8_9PROT|nr:cupin domain-containing protein [Thalassobaculum fulvum]GHD63398.1 hypothetical protein GCM10017083_53590 [Thalassobaculum fulvum]
MTKPPESDRYEPRAFGRGVFHVQHARDADWKPGFRGFFDYRDLGMVEKTGGKLRAHVHRPNGPCQGQGDLHYHLVDFQMVYVLKGWARVHFDGVGEVLMEEGSCMYQEPEIRHRVIEYSDDYTALELLVPAESETVSVEP